MFKITIQFSCDWLRKTSRKDKSVNSIEKQNLMSLANETIKALEDVRAKSTIDNYKTALRSFIHFAGTEVSMQHLNARLLEAYQQWLHRQNVTLNGISCYMRSLRSLLCKIEPEANVHALFNHVFTGKMRTDKRSIPMEDIVRLRQLRLPQCSDITFSRDIFLFSFYALGMPFVDIAFLQKQQLKDGYIVYHRHKTGQRIRVKIEPPMQTIINRYTTMESLFVFPILDMQGKKDLITVYESARSRYNRHLKKIGILAGLSRQLTSYVARHSWATTAYQANVDLSVISKALGHTSPNTTLTYIREIDDNRIDVANHRLLSATM